MWMRARSIDQMVKSGVARFGSAAAQPRPALGRRPWFAFLRRARSFLRFALAIVTVRVTVSLDRAITTPITLHTEGWQRGQIAVTRPGPTRRRGLTPRAAGRALLFRAAVVHSFGMREVLGVIGISRYGIVVSSRVLPPRRLAILRGAFWVLELPGGEARPSLGSRLRVGAPT